MKPRTLIFFAIAYSLQLVMFAFLIVNMVLVKNYLVASIDVMGFLFNLWAAFRVFNFWKKSREAEKQQIIDILKANY